MEVRAYFFFSFLLSFYETELNLIQWPKLSKEFIGSYKYACLIQFIFLIRHLYLIGVWLGEDQETNTIKTHV